MTCMTIGVMSPQASVELATQVRGTSAAAILYYTTREIINSFYFFSSIKQRRTKDSNT